MVLFCDRVLLWCWAVAGCSALLSITLAPWMMRLSLRKRGAAIGSLLRRAVACFLMGAAFPIALFLLFGLLAHPVLLIPGVGGVVLLFKLMGKRPRLPVSGRHLGIILLCNLIYFAAWLPALNRCRELGKRCIDGANLHGIGQGLLAYRDKHGAFPDDLRQLVDAGLGSANMLVPVLSDTREEFRQTRPYSGPCEFNYVRLPRNAPDGLVWVWQDPKYHRGDGAWVLYTWGSVEWVTPGKLREDIGNTEAWLRTMERELPPSTASTAPIPK